MTDLTVAEPVRPGRIDYPTPRVKQAIELMVWQGLPFNQAAKEARLTVRAMRLALEKPNVIRYLREQKQIFREAANGKNIVRLCQIRDAADNMPAVNAIKVLEQLDDEQTTTKQTTSPGITINIVSAQHASDMAVHAIDQPGNKHRLADVPSADSTEHVLVKAMSDQTILDPDRDKTGG
jgi:hypothetical protein